MHPCYGYTIIWVAAYLPRAVANGAGEQSIAAMLMHAVCLRAATLSLLLLLLLGGPTCASILDADECIPVSSTAATRTPQSSIWAHKHTKLSKVDQTQLQHAGRLLHRCRGLRAEYKTQIERYRARHGSARSTTSRLSCSHSRKDSNM